MKKLTFLLIIILSTILSLFSEELVLAKNGKTNYQIVISGETPKGVWNAKFLAWFLKEKTGAEFPICLSGKINLQKPSIILGNSKFLQNFVGKYPYKDMKNQDHIVKSIGTNIILYGKGYDADFYAITEFLDRCLSFRYYQRSIMPKIKKTPSLKIKPFDYRLSWALKYRELPQTQFSDYFRGETTCRNKKRQNKHIKNNLNFSINNWFTVLQAQKIKIDPVHTAWLYLPTKGSHRKGYSFIKNRDYFKTNPEFYAINRNGQRGKEYPCFATKAIRREFIKNIEEHFKVFGTDNVKIEVTYPDGTDVCHCSRCKELAEKYGTPGGAYFEFIMELGNEFMQTHPKTTVIAMMYQKGQTQIPPRFQAGKKFPPNILFTYCDIVSKTNKTWDAHENKQAFEWLKKAKAITHRLRVWTYYAHYGEISFLPYASDNILVDNIRQVAKLGLEGLFFEFYPYNTGYGNDYMNFSDLNIYLFYRFCKNPHLDYDKEVKEFIDHVYGPAAKLVRKYHDELVRLCTTENKYGIRLSASNFNKELSYLTPDNIYKWEIMFDKMTELVKNSPEQIRKNIANLRRAVDVAAYGRWPELQKKYAVYFNNPSIFRDRIGEPKYNFSEAARNYLTRSELKITYMGKEKPLPEQFKDIPSQNIKRLVPRNMANNPQMSQIPKIITDNDAAFGYAASIDVPDMPFNFGFYYVATKQHGPRVTLEDWDIDSPGKYKLYHLGEVKPTLGKCIIWFSSKSWNTNLDLSTVFDPTNVNVKYDVWISLKFPRNYQGKKNELVLCDQIILIKK